jgi:hypothetical protein
VKELCPACATPGFGIVEWERGLPCSGFGAPTEKVAATILGCERCRHQEVIPIRRAASLDPKHCPACNP